MSKSSTQLFLFLLFLGQFSAFVPSAFAESEPKPTIDFSTFVDQGVQQLDTCLKPYEADATTASGNTIKMLGVALVYMGPTNGSSILGHVGERFVYCRDNKRFDVLYDYAPLSADQINAGPDNPVNQAYETNFNAFSAAEKKSMVGSLYVNMSFKPANDYDIYQTEYDRTIQEAWLDTDGQNMYKMLIANTDRYEEQNRKLAAHEPLPPYELLSDNCLKPVKQDLAIVNPSYVAKNNLSGLTPSFYFGFMKGQKVEKIIVYPSQTLFRIIRLKQEGKSTLLEGFVPLSSVLKGAFGKSWVLFFENGGGPWRRFFLSPLIGAANFLAATAETIYGVATLPVSLTEKAIQKNSPNNSEVDKKPNQTHWSRLKQALSDLESSTSQMLWLELRYPEETKWSSEETQFFKDLTQNSALLEFLETEWDQAPIGLGSTATSATPVAPTSANSSS
jgi:hypothetical protein